MTVFIALSLLSGCLQEVDKTQYDFVDNPTHDFDQDGYLDVEDCDDADPFINLKVRWYQDLEVDGFPNEDLSEVPNQRGWVFDRTQRSLDVTMKTPLQH